MRLEDADRLARWLFGEHAVAPTPDYRLNLREPVPVYMTYFTAAPSPAGVQVRRDIYGWDSVSLATRQANADQQGQLQGVMASIVSLASIFGPLYFAGFYFGIKDWWPGLIWIIGVGTYLLAIPLILAIRNPPRAPAAA